MKYIRTKDKIYEVDNDKYSVVELNGNQLLNINVDDKLIHREYIIAKADTIEELCDCLVIENIKCYPIGEKRVFTLNHTINGNGWHYEKIISCDVFYNSKCQTLKGAIWTNKGLIYVARMNSKGEMELL